MSTTVTNHTVNYDRLRWNLISGSTEGNTFYVNFSDGGLLLLQIVYSTMSWSPSVQATCRYYASGTHEKKGFTSNISGSEFHASEDKFSVKCENINIVFDKENKVYKATFDQKPGTFVDLTFTIEDDLIQVNDGIVYFNDTNPDTGYISSQFAPKCKVSGTLIFDGIPHESNGTGLFVKALQHKPQHAGRWNFVNFQTEKDALLMYQWEMPESSYYTLDKCSQGCIILNNKIVAVTLDNSAKFLSTAPDSFSGYEIPEEIAYSWSGVTDDGRPVKITMQSKLTTLLDKVDLLQELPYLIRKFIQATITAPFLYQWVENATAHIEIGDEKFDLAGTLFQESTFMASLPN